jgi:hypothetical protein
MSANKFKYFEVTTTKVVRALNKRDAITAASRASRVPNTEVMVSEVWAERIPATNAHQLVETA